MESRPAPAFSPAAPGAPPPQPAAAPAVFRIQPDDRERSGRRPACSTRRRILTPAPAAGSPLPEFTLRSAAAPAPRLDFSAPPLEVTPGPPPSGKLLAPPRRARRVSARGHPAARDVALGAFGSAAARPDPRELHHRRRPRRTVDHRPARGPRAHSVRAGDEAARRRPRGDAAPADAADPAAHARAADRLRAHRRRTATPRASRPSPSAIGRSR